MNPDRPQETIALRSLALFLALLSCSLTGCGSSRKTPDTYPVTGTVTYRGSPLPEVNVIFHPDKGRQAMGTTGPDGRFSLSTFKSGDGAVPGHHRVAVTSAATSGPMPGSPEYRQAKPGPLPFPLRYRDPARSGLEATVGPDGENDFTFELVDQPPR